MNNSEEPLWQREIKSWESNDNEVVGFTDDGRAVTRVPVERVVRKDWDTTFKSAAKRIGPRFAEAIADKHYFRTDAEAFAYLGL